VLNARLAADTELRRRYPGIDLAPLHADDELAAQVHEAEPAAEEDAAPPERAAVPLDLQAALTPQPAAAASCCEPQPTTPDLYQEMRSWDLGQVDMSAESKLPGPGQITVHDWAIGKLQTGDPGQWIIKDDGAGELADILVIEQQQAAPAQLTVTFVHCKWSGEDTVGRRREDLYELMGQAVRTVRWTGSGVIWAELSRRLVSRASIKVVVVILSR